MIHNHPRAETCTWKCPVYFGTYIEKEFAKYPGETVI